MKAKTTWAGHKMKFQSESRGHISWMDSQAPFGEDTAATPKEYVLQGLCGCTGMDVVALLRKYKQDFSGVSVEATTDLTKEAHPHIFTDIHLVYEIKGNSVDHEKAKEAVYLSKTKFCGVSAILSKSSKITYEIRLNDEVIERHVD